LGSNFQVNDDQGSVSNYPGVFGPSISSDDSGNFIIVWDDQRNGNSDIYAQRYSSDGTELGSNFLVNDYLRNENQHHPSISTNSAGNFIIIWQDEGNGDTDIYAQRYASDGTALGSNFKVNDDLDPAEQTDPTISVDSNGNFIIAWQDSRFQRWSDIYAQRYKNDGTAMGINFKVNDDIGEGGQYNPSISADGNGVFIITWRDGRNGNFIYAQRYSSEGKPLGSNFKVSVNESNTWYGSRSVSADENGNFIITWDDIRNGNWKIYAQRYASDGKKLGSNFQVTNTGEGSHKEPDVKLWNKRIYNTWQDDHAGGTGRDIWANVLDWEGEYEGYMIPSEYILHQNYPNPFNSSTTIEFDLPKAANVSVEVYNMLGQNIKSLVNKELNEGMHLVEFHGQNFASGLYFYRIEAGEFQDVKKMILIK
jgi:hypothetical protein